MNDGYHCADCQWRVRGDPVASETSTAAIDHHLATGHTVERADVSGTDGF